jgi:hypothetical protein
MLIAEELLLVASAPDGTSRGKGTELECATGGALLIELVLGEYAELDGKVIRARDGVGAPADPILAEALAATTTTPRRPKVLVRRLSKGTRQRLLSSLVAAGVLADVQYRWLGLFTRHRYPVTAPDAREEVLGRLRAAVVDGQSPSPRTAALASMIGAAGLEKRVFPDADRRVVRRRLRELADGDWAAKAVRDAIAAIHAATVGAAVAASSAATSGGATG